MTDKTDILLGALKMISNKKHWKEIETVKDGKDVVTGIQTFAEVTLQRFYNE